MTIEQSPILPYKPSTLETVDYAIYEWLDEQMNIFCTTNEGWSKVPIIWVIGERSGQRANKIRKRSGIVKFPVMTIERTSVTKDLTKKGAFYGNVMPVNDYKGGSITIAKFIKQDKTANFQNADAARRLGVNGTVRPTGGQINFPSRKKKEKIVYEIISVPMPVYVDINYSITIKTEYQQQMNEIIQPFATKTYGVNHFFVKKDGHEYESFMQGEFSQQNNVADLGQDRRSFVTKVDIKTLGYLVGQGKNDPYPARAIRENAVEFKFPREKTVFEDEPEWGPVQGQPGKYRP
jgi:hypothetical protein